MDHFDGHNPLSGGEEWTKRASASFLTEAGQEVLVYYKQRNREMSSLSKLTSEPTFCLTNSPPPSSKWESLFQQGLFLQVVTLKSQQLDLPGDLSSSGYPAG